MKTIALRFSNNYAPPEGTIFLHNEIINNKGYVWYGKFGNNISQKVRTELMTLKNKKILLINSGTAKRYWAYFDKIDSSANNEFDCIPEYYRKDFSKIKCWFRIIRFEPADSNVLSKCFVFKTGQVLSLASKYSMTPYFIIDYKE